MLHLGTGGRPEIKNAYFQFSDALREQRRLNATNTRTDIQYVIFCILFYANEADKKKYFKTIDVNTGKIDISSWNMDKPKLNGAIAEPVNFDFIFWDEKFNRLAEEPTGSNTFWWHANQGQMPKIQGLPQNIRKVFSDFTEDAKMVIKLNPVENVRYSDFNFRVYCVQITYKNLL